MSETKEVTLCERESTGVVLTTNIDELEIFVASKLLEYTPENYKGILTLQRKTGLRNASKKEVSISA